MQAQLGEIVRELQEAQERLHRLAARVPSHRWSVRARGETWSVGECIAHLNLTSKACVPLLQQAFAAAPNVAAPPRRYRRDPVGWLISATTGPLPVVAGRRLGRVRTAPAFVPGASADRDASVAEFDGLQRELIALTHAAEQKPLEAIRITSPFDARVKYNAYACLLIQPRHQHRHLGQAEQVWPV